MALPELEQATADLQEAVRCVAANVHKDREEWEREQELKLRELEGGHLLRANAEVEENQEACWGERAGWGETEDCTRFSMQLRDLNAPPQQQQASSRSFWAPRAAGQEALPELIGPFTLEETRDERRVRVKRRPFQEGGMRFAFLCEDVTGCAAGQYSSAIRLVAKESKYIKAFPGPGYEGQLENRREFYTGDMLAQMLAQALVLRFNALSPPKLVQMLTPMLYEFPQRHDPERRFMAAELSLRDQGAWARYSDNQSFQRPYFSSMMALSHWSWQHTQGRYMLVDLQGVGYVLSDPQIHSRDRDSLAALGFAGTAVDQFGQGDLGEAGMTAFFEQHFCNAVCHKLKLRRHERQPVSQPAAELDEPPATKVLTDYASSVIGRCGHLFELGPKERKQFFSNNQNVLCTACNKAKGGGFLSFFQ